MKHIFKYFFSVPVLILVLLSGCKQKPEIALKLKEHYQNDVYDNFDTAAYHAEFKKQLTLLSPALRYADTLKNYYTANGFEPHFTTNFLINGQLRTLVQYLQRSAEHGLNPAAFQPDMIARELDTIQANRFTNIGLVYPAYARLEILSANSLLNYSNILQFGVVNPHKLYRRYDMQPKRPDNAATKKVFDAGNLGVYLEQLQPVNETYLQLKKALADINPAYIDSPKLARILTIKLNMERLRWQIPAKESRYIRVNIPAFNLQWIEGGKQVLTMKVCTGEPRPNDYEERFKQYIKTKDFDTKPLNHETTILSSHINTIQLNPTWSIPTSIAQTEIYYAIQKNPDYFAQNNIRVFYKGVQVADPDTINWASVSRQKMPYSFKQDASDLNALGKFKFIFDNEAGIYLHDTPNKKAFFKPWRAVSHGCVRVEDPFAFTQLLVGDTSKLDNIRMEVGMEPHNEKNLDKYAQIQLERSADGYQLKSKYIGVKPVQLFIDYYTCWPDESGQPVFYYDAYRMDNDLAKAMGKYLGK